MKYNEDGQWKDVQIKVANAIQNEYGESNNDGYSQNYLNDKLVNVSTEVDDTYRVNLLETKNLFDKDTAINNYGFPNLTDGTITYSQSNWKYVYISCKPNTKYTLSGVSSESTGTGITMYNGNTFLSSATTYKNGTFTTASTATKLCVGCRDTELNTLQLEEGETATTYEVFIPNQIVVDNEKYSDTLNVGASLDNRSRVNVLHSKNLLPNNSSTITTNGITFTKNSDGSITINGTSTARADLYIFGGTTDNGNYLKIKKGTYSFDKSNLNDGKIFFAFREKTAGAKYETLTNNGAIETMATQDCYFSGVMIGVERGNTLNNLTIYPMLNEGNTLLPYEPYITPSIYVDNEEIYNKGISEYSTTEHRVGTWIDGKPLYRKVFYRTSNLSSSFDITHGISNVAYIKVEGQLTTSTTSTPPFYNNSTDFFRVFRNGAYLSARFGSGISATSITFIVEYTKTTD